MWVYIVCFIVHSLFTTSLSLVEPLYLYPVLVLFSFVCSSSVREGGFAAFNFGLLYNSSPFEYELKGQLLFVVRHFYSCNKFVHCQFIGAFNYFILKQVLFTDTHVCNIKLSLFHNTRSKNKLIYVTSGVFSLAGNFSGWSSTGAATDE